MKPIPNDYTFPDAINTDQGNLSALLESVKIDLSKDLPPPPVALKVNGEIFGTLGNFSLLIGKAKSKKTFLATLSMAGALGSKGIFEGCLPPGKQKVVFIDTEQGEYHVNKVGKRVLRLLGGTDIPENFIVYGFRKIYTDTRRSLVEYLIETHPDIGLLIIDGIKDLVHSINDESEATSIADALLRWTEEYGIHIITVLHQNKNDKNARGHLGTELVNKAETVVSVEKEPKTDVSKVEVEYSRNKEFAPFGFQVDSFGLPEIVEGWKPKDTDKAKNKGASPEEIDDYLHRKILQEVKSNSDKPKNAELIQQIVYAVTKHYEQIGESKAKVFKQYYQNEGFIIKVGKDRGANTYYEIHPEGSPESDE
jgi:hypothetical protein